MKFGQFMLNYEKKKNEKVYKKGDLETSPRPFLIFKESIKRNLRMPAMLIWTNFNNFAIR